MKRPLSILLVLMMIILSCSSGFCAEYTAFSSRDAAVSLMGVINQALLQYYAEDAFVFNAIVSDSDEYIQFSNENGDAFCTMRYSASGDVNDIYFDVSGMTGLYALDMVGTVLASLIEQRFGEESIAFLNQWYPDTCSNIADGLAESDMVMFFHPVEGTNATLGMGAERTGDSIWLLIYVEGYADGLLEAEFEQDPVATDMLKPATAEELAWNGEEVYVPFGKACNITAEIGSDGQARRNLQDDYYETLNFTLKVKSYKSQDYYQKTYSDSYLLQGNEAAVELEITLNGYNGNTEIIPQNCLKTTFVGVNESIAVQGYQLADAEIEGIPGVVIASDVPTTVYKRYPYSVEQGDMEYMLVTSYVNGEKRTYRFEIPVEGSESVVSQASVNDAKNTMVRIAKPESAVQQAAAREEKALVAEEKKNQALVQGDFEYDLYGDEAIITGFKQDNNSPSGVLVVPSEIEGCKVVKLEMYALKSIPQMEDLVLPDTLKHMGYYAIDDCHNLKELVIPDSVITMESIGDCESLERVYIGKGLQEYNTLNTSDLPALKEFVVPEENRNLYAIDGVLFGYQESSYMENGNLVEEKYNVLLKYPSAKPDREYKIPEGINIIRTGAFSACENLEKVIEPDSLKYNGSYSYCSNLREIHIGAGAQGSSGAYVGCLNLSKIKISNQNKNMHMVNGVLFDNTYGERLLYYMPTLTQSRYTIPGWVEHIEYGAFWDSSLLLNHIEVLEGVQSISYNAFEGVGIQEKGATISLPESIVEIGNDAFEKNVTVQVVKGSYAEEYMLNENYEKIGSSGGISEFKGSKIEFSGTLTVGDRGYFVKRIQEKLIEMGILDGAADGIFGKKTAAAVKAIQGIFGEKETGVVDLEWYEAIVGIE